MKSDLVDLTMILHHQTPSAILVSDTEDGEKVWLPKSRIELEDVSGRIVVVTMPERLALEKGLI